MMGTVNTGNQHFAISDDVKRSIRAGHLFRGSRDFFLAHELLSAFGRSAEARAGRAPTPIQGRPAQFSRWSSG
jgi:hypothetical protein